MSELLPQPSGAAVLFARLVKFEHTIFALPFAYVGAFLAVGGVPSVHSLLWVTVAMVGARSLAMALNRLIDAGNYRWVEVRGEGSVSAAPDFARVTLGVTSTGRTAGETMQSFPCCQSAGVATL